MNREAMAVHMRLANLPTYRHRSEPEEVLPRSLVGVPTEGRTSRHKPAPARSAAIARDVEAAGVKPRKQRTNFTILAARPNRWGWAHGDLLEVTRGKLAGCTGRYVGASNSETAFVLIDGVKRGIVATRLRKVKR